MAASLLLVAVAAAVAYRQRLRLTREIVAAGVRAGVQLIAVSAILLVLFRRAGLPGEACWVTVMILIAAPSVIRRLTTNRFEQILRDRLAEDHGDRRRWTSLPRCLVPFTLDVNARRSNDEARWPSLR